MALSLGPGLIVSVYFAVPFIFLQIVLFYFSLQLNKSHCAYVSHSIIHSSVDGHDNGGWLHYLTIKNSTTINRDIQVSVISYTAFRVYDQK